LLFERVAKTRDWPDEDCELMLRCVLSGKSQEAYSSLSLKDSSSYSKIKAAVLKVYELVPEAYRQRFRSLERRMGAWVGRASRPCGSPGAVLQACAGH